MPKPRKAFLTEYGVDQYMRWKNLRNTPDAISLRTFEQKIRAEGNLPPGSPIMDQFDKDNR